jgi:hypothetical protein
VSQIGLAIFLLLERLLDEAINRAVINLIDKKRFEMVSDITLLCLSVVELARMLILYRTRLQRIYNEYGIDISNSFGLKILSWEKKMGFILIDLYRVKNTTIEKEYKKLHVKGGFERLQQVDKNYRVFKKAKGVMDYTDFIMSLIKLISLLV